MYKDYDGDFQADVDRILSGPTEATGDYTSDIRSHKALKDARFLMDLRGFYEEKGDLGLTDEQLIEKFYEDRTWADWNTASALKDAASAHGMGEEQRARAMRIETVWRNLPMAWQEGGRGVGAALGDVLPAVLLDPVNLIPGVAAGKAGVTAGRAAYLSGKSSPMLRGAGRGAAVGGASEAAISGGQAAVHDTALQARDIQLNLQDEFDTGRLLGTTALGTAAGAGVGGLIGAGAGALGSRRGVKQAKRTQDEAGPPPEPAEEPAAGSVPEEAPDTRDIWQKQLDELGPQIERNYEAEHEDLTNLINSGASEEAIEEARQRVAEFYAFRNLSRRLEGAKTEIDALAGSADPAKRAEGEERAAAFHLALARLKAATDPDSGEIDLALLNRDVERATGVATEADAKAAMAGGGPRADAEGTATADTATQPGPEASAEAPTEAGRAETEVEPEAAPAREPAPVAEAELPDIEYSRGKVRENTAKTLEDAGLSETDLKGLIDNGRVQLSPTGKFVNQSLKELRAVIKNEADSADFKAAMGGEAQAETPLARTWQDIEQDVASGNIDLDEAARQLEDIGIDPADLGGELMSARDYFLAIRDAEGLPVPDYWAGTGTPVPSIRVRQLAVTRGVDWRTIQGTGKDGKITKADVKKAEPDTEYETAVNRDLEAVRQGAETLLSAGHIVDRKTYRDVIQSLARDEDIATDVDDIMALFDDVYARSFDEIADDVRAGLLSADDAVRELNLSSRQPQIGGRSVARDKAKETLLAINQTVEEAVEFNFTTSEQKLIRKITKNRMEEKGEPRHVAEANAQMQIMQRHFREKGKASGDLKSSGGRVAETKNIEGAGRDPRTGKIQGILRKGIPTSEGRTVNTSGLARGEQKFINESNFTADAAMAHALGSRGEGRVIYEYTATGPVRGVMTARGRKSFPAGSVLYADPVTRRHYETRELAMQARGDFAQKPAPVTTSATRSETPSAEGAPDPVNPSDIQILIKDAIARKDVATLKRLVRAVSEPTSEPTPKPKAETPEVAEAPRADQDTPVKLGDRVLILQSINRPGDVRLAGKTQRTSKPTVQAIIGKNEKPEDWLARYALADEAEGVKNSLDKRKLWNSPNTIENDPQVAEIGIDGREYDPSAPGIRRYVGDETGLEEALPTEQFDTMNLGLWLGASKTEYRVGGKSYRYDEFLGLVSRELGDPGDMTPTLARHLRNMTARLEKISYRRWEKDHFIIGEMLSGLYAMQRELSPGGIVHPTQARAESVRQIQDILSSRSPDEVALAGKIISRLGGDPERGPVFEEGVGWSYRSFDPDRPDNFIKIGPDGGHTNTFLLLHELGHWSYRNILTPEDRAEFWDAFGGHLWHDQGHLPSRLIEGDMRVPEAPPNITNQNGPQEYFANQFATWAMRNQTDGIFAKPGFWERIGKYVEALYNWVVKREVIQPDLVPLFSKILPEQERAYLRLGVDEAETRLQQAVVKHHTELNLARDSINDAIRSGNPDGIIAAFANAQTTLARAAPARAIPGQATNAGATFSVYRPLEKMIRDRFGDINQVLSGKANPYARAPGALQDTNVSLGDMLPEARINKSYAELSGVSDYNPEEVADTLAELWEDGHAGGFQPLVRPVNPTEDSVFAGNTSISRLFDMMERSLEAAFASEGKHMNVVPPSLRKADAETPSAEAKTAAKRVKTSEDATAERAVKEAKTPKRKRARSGKTSSADGTFAGEVRSASRKELIEIYRREAGTDRGDQIAEIILAKAKAEPLPAKKLEPRKEVKQGTVKDFEVMLAEAFDAADSKLIDEILYEVTRRAVKKAARPKPAFREVHTAVAQELGDHAGVQTSAGIPASARGQVRTMLGYLTHRDPEVEVAMRTMTYRMVNLLGKTQRGTIEDANFMTMGDMSRLSGQPLSGTESGAFLDFRSPTFNHLRKDLRRMSVALNKGQSTPFDAMHEVSHLLVRSGVLPQRELDAIKETYRGVNADDPLKKRINDTYRKKYEGREYTDYEMDDVLSEEWFAESFTQYLAERVAKGDIAQAALTGNPSAVVLRGTINRAIDRLVEYVSYVLNGLIGRNDIKQTFRRITLFGDMLENTARPPMASRRLVVDPTNAAAYASDRYVLSSNNKQAKIARYVESGLGFDEASGKPVTWYHATPVAHRFDKDANPDQVFAASTNGNYGPGQYLSVSPNATRVYGETPTATALLRAIDEAENLTPEQRDNLVIDALHVSGLRKEMSRLRQEYSQAIENPPDDEVGAFVASERLPVIKEQLDRMAEEELAISELFRKYDIASNPGVIPFYIRATKPADFRTDAFYKPNDEFVRLLMNNLNEVPTIEIVDMSRFANEVAQGVDGRQLYQAYVRAFKGGGSNSDAAAKELATLSLQDKGYDSLLTTHYNSVDNADIQDMMPDGRPYGTEVRGHETVVLFDESQSKHIDADYFDQHDERMFYREVEDGGSAVNAEITTGWADGADPKQTNWDAVSESLEMAGATRAEADAMRSVAMNRALDAQEEQALRKNSPWFFLQEQSTRMKNLGMHWVGDWYKEHFPEVSQQFAGTFMPIRQMLRKLPDSDGRVRAWARASTASVGQKQPKSYTRIVRALRRGFDSQQYKNLTDQEKEIWTKIRQAMSAERDKMIEAGMMVGFRKDYMPQVWNKEAIQKNRDEFLLGMARLYKRERTSKGDLAEEVDAMKFADRMYETLADDSADGVMSPIHGSTRNPKFEHGDFSRMIELDKDPQGLRDLEKFLESDLEFLLTKYFEGSSRRLVHTKKFGLNSHGYYDYLMAMDQGEDGIVRLLSTNREYRKDVRYKGADGYPEDGRVIDTTPMPFAGNEPGAATFVRDLVEIHKSQGSGAARQKLDEIAPKSAAGDIHPTYARRADAIVAALDDFKGRSSPLTTANYNFMDNAMRVARRQPLTTGGGQTAYKMSRTLRNINSVTLLSFTTLTSIPDVALPIIRSGSFNAWRKGLSRWALDPEYRQMMKNVGVAMENIIHDRMTYMYGAADGKTTHAFFNATMLTPWTDMNRQIAGATAVEAFIAMQKKTIKNWDETKPLAEQNRQFKTAYRFLKRYGLSDFAHGQRRGNETLADPSLLDGDNAVDELRRGIIKFADESIYAPNPNDIPLWGQTPFGSMMFQLKSFPLMMTRLTGYTLKEAKQGNIKPLAYLATLGPAVGAGALGIKDIIQMRGGEENREAALRKRNLLKTMGYDEKVHGNEDDFLGWYVESMMHMGAMGIVADSLGAAGRAVENGTYGQNRFASWLFGPTYGLTTSMFTAAAGLVDDSDNSNAKERAAVREAATRIPVVGGIRGLREGIVDLAAGEYDKGGSGSGWGSWGSGWN